jgi:hypothetical protein
MYGGVNRRSPEVSDVWQQSLQKLQTGLNKIDTDPELIDIIINYLNAWRYDHALIPLDDEKYRLLLENQNTIGARQFLEGWLHWDWELMQEQFYQDIKSRRSTRQWTIAVITKLWDIAWDLWEFRNAVFHQRHNQTLQEDSLALDVQIRDMCHTITITGLLPKDQHLAAISLTCLIDFPRSRKIEWLQQMTLALAHARKRNFDLRRSRHEQHRRHQCMIESMQNSLRNWLLSHS